MSVLRTARMRRVLARCSPASARRSSRSRPAPAPRLPRSRRRRRAKTRAGSPPRSSTVILGRRRAAARRAVARGPRLPRGGARCTRRQRSRGAPPKSRWPRACAARAGGREAVGRARPGRRAAEADPRGAGRRQRRPDARSTATTATQGRVSSKLLADAALTERGVGETFLQLNRLFGARRSDKRQVFELVRELAKPYPNERGGALRGRARGATTRGAAGCGDRDGSRWSEIDRALALKPDWDRAALLKAELLGQAVADEAIALPRASSSRPTRTRGRCAARSRSSYVEQKRYGEARARVRRPAGTATAAQREFEFGVAVHLGADEGLGRPPKSLFRELEARRLRRRRARSSSTSRRSRRRHGRYDEAIERYKAVPEGERGWLAKLRVAAMMGKQGKRRRGAALSRRPAGRHDRAARAGAAGGSAAPARRQRQRGRLRRARAGARRSIPIRPTSSTTRRWWPRSSTASTTPRRGCAASSSSSPTMRRR